MGSNSLVEYNKILNQLNTYTNIPQHLISSFRHFSLLIYRSDEQNRFSEPMPWIGIYIALASLLCTLAMVADLVHGIRAKKLWFPSKYFTLNAASLSVIAVAIKLPMDLNNSMPGHTDQDAKIGSLAFMCTMMANLLPSLATMDNKELLTNIIALSVLVITLVVNVCIQIKTGLLSLYKYQDDLFETTNEGKDQSSSYMYVYTHRYGIVSTFYLGMLLMLLLTYVSSSVAILKSKQILNSKYQGGHERALKELESAGRGRLTVEKLKQHVTSYWIMAGTSSPGFVTACSATTSASGVICACSAGLAVLLMYLTIGYLREYKSDYKWSMLVIFITQFIGVILGSIAPLFRCFAYFSFNLSIKWMWNHHINVFKVESYWTQKLCDWKHSSIPFSVSSRIRKVIIRNLISAILSICIGFQKTVVVACKMIALIPILLVISVLYCTSCWKRMNKSEQLDKFKDLRRYIFTLEEDIELAERTLKGMTKSVNLVIRKAEKQQPSNLIKLLEGCSSFEGVGGYGNGSLHVPVLHTEDDHDLTCWSLTLVTLTAIAISIPNVSKKVTDRLLSSVSESLVYVTLVEESFNIASDGYVSKQKAAKSLWLEVELYHKWLGNELTKLAPQVTTAKQILESFRDTAENLNTEVGSLNICAESMYHTTKTFLFSYGDTIDKASREELFGELSSMIADLSAACLTNLPRVIAMKCHTNVIEKREESVHAATELLGETMQIINMLQDHQLPTLNTEELRLTDKWRGYLKHPSS
ncbi:hypothetical protein SSX86_014378 [Deinandra increscens subsp. villosa]|uniref:Uncharacterized protein n=1 Tax=Deinandra increscens subsp. villosa TaxID=3103831 RepID=A0AAP0D256_9ASTR